MRSDFELQNFTFRSEKPVGILMQSDSIAQSYGIKSDWESYARFGAKL